jgi:hypothetical protein
VVLAVLTAFRIHQTVTDVSEENARILGVLLTLNLEALRSFETSIAVYE